MAYGGYLLKIGDYKIDAKKYIKFDSYSPYVNMQDLEPWTDSNGYLHRKPVKLKVAKIEFETPAGLTNTEFAEFMKNIRKQYTDANGRQCYFTAYIPEYDDYVTQFGYIADFQPNIYGIKNEEIIYDAIKFSVIGGVYHG